MGLPAGAGAGDKVDLQFLNATKSFNNNGKGSGLWERE